jgi:hypothetical protein
MRAAGLAFVLVATATGCLTPDDGGARAGFTIQNGSSLGLAEVRLSALREQSWEPSLITSMAPGTEQAVASIACARYDVLVRDDRARSCVLPMVHLCFANGVWFIDDVTLEQCRWTR